MTKGDEYEALFMMVNTNGWQKVIVPEIQRRFDDCVLAWMHTAGQTTENIHKAAGMAAAYDFILKGIPGWIENLAQAIESDKEEAEGKDNSVL